MRCKDPTPRLQHDSGQIPKKYNKSNNLIKSAEDFYRASGLPIFITGRVVDVNCVPVSGAAVFAWHANTWGGFQYKPDDLNQKKYTIDKIPFLETLAFILFMHLLQCFFGLDLIF